jgi:hypothetical protein
VQISGAQSINLTVTHIAGGGSSTDASEQVGPRLTVI